MKLVPEILVACKHLESSLYQSATFKNVLSLDLQIVLHLNVFKSNTVSECLNQTRLLSKIQKKKEKDEMFSRMTSEYRCCLQFVQLVEKSRLRP